MQVDSSCPDLWIASKIFSKMIKDGQMEVKERQKHRKGSRVIKLSDTQADWVADVAKEKVFGAGSMRKKVIRTEKGVSVSFSEGFNGWGVFLVVKVQHREMEGGVPCFIIVLAGLNSRHWESFSRWISVRFGAQGAQTTSFRDVVLRKVQRATSPSSSSTSGLPVDWELQLSLINAKLDATLEGLDDERLKTQTAVAHVRDVLQPVELILDLSRR